MKESLQPAIPALFTSCRRLCACALFAATLCSSAGGQSSEGREYQVYPIQHKSVAEVERILSEMLGDLGPTTHLVADLRRNQILLRGPQKAQQIARQLIDAVDHPPTRQVSAKPVVKRYSCPTSRLAETADWIRSRYAGPAGVRVATDPQSSQLLVLAPPDIHLAIAKELGKPALPSVGHGNAPPNVQAARSQVDTKGAAERIHDEQFVGPLHAGVDEIEPQLRRLLGSRLEPLPRRQPDGTNYLFVDAAGRRVELRVDGRRNGMLIVGTGSLVRQFVRLVEALDALARPQQEPDKTLRIVPVHRADPAKVRQALDAYQSRSGKQDGTRGRQGRSSVPGTQKTGRIGRLRRKEIELVQYLAQLDETGAGPTARSATQAMPTGEQEDEQGQALRELGEEVEIETLPDLDVIIIRGRDRDIDEVSRIIAEIERISAIAEPIIDVYMLEHVSGESLVEIVDLVAEDLAGGRQGSVHITPLVKPNALLLIGWGEAIGAIKELIAKLDQPVAPETQLRVFPLRHAPAAAAGATLDGFFADRGGLGPRVQVEPDSRTNSLIIRAAPRDMAEVEHLLQRLDRGSGEAVSQARIFKLNNSLADDLAATLQSAIDAASGDGTRKSAVLELLAADVDGQRILKSGILADVEITPDAHTNTLIVAAPAESMDLLAALIEELDSPTAVAQIKVFKIINGDANSLIQMLRTLLPTQTGAAGPQLAGAEGETTLVPVRFSVDQRTNSIIATGSEGDLAIIEALLLRLDAEDVEERQNSVYSLKNAPAPAVATAIDEFLQRERVVQQAAPGALSPYQQIESVVVVVPEPVTNSLIISASPRFYDEIMELVEKLDRAPAQVMIQVVIAEVELNNIDEFGVELGIQDSILFDRSLLGDLITTTRTTQQSTEQGIVTVTEDVIQSATNTPGFDFSNNPLGNSGSDKAFARAGNVAGQALSSFSLGRTSGELGYGGLVLSASSEAVSVLIRALQETRRLDVLGRPQIMTLDNQPAYIQVGKLVPRISATRFQSNYQTNEIVLEPTGLIMGVTPRVSPEGKVVMEIDAEKSDLGPEAEGIPVSVVEGTVIRQSSINMTLAQTTVSAADGETIVLGGLITKKDSSVHRRVPWLARVPVLGNLFRYDNETGQRTELLIILTPHVVSTPEEAERIRQLEAARMSWCLADVQEIHGSAGLFEDRDTSAWHGAGEVIYPDVNPRGSKAGEYVPKAVFPEELRLAPPIQQAPTRAPARDDRILPPPNLWNPPGQDEAPGTSAPADDSGPGLESGQTDWPVEQTSWVPSGPVEQKRSFRFADVPLPTKFALPLSSARRQDYGQSVSPPQSEPSEYGTEYPLRRLSYQ